MQAVILAAGKGVRCHPLTLTRPKALLKVANKTLLEHNLMQLQGIAEEALIVYGYLGDKITQTFGASYGKLRLRYVTQKDISGTASALLTAKPLLKRDRFLVMNGDDLYSKEDIARCIKHKLCILAHEVPDPEKWGILEVSDGKVTGIEEKPKKPKSSLANTGLYVLTPEIFDHPPQKSQRGEYELTEYLAHLIKKKKDVACERAESWIPVGYPWHMLDANEKLLRMITKSVMRGTIEKGATIKGTIVLGEKSILKSGAYIEGNVIIGNNSVIGPNCYIRGSTSIGDNCKVGNAVEIKNSIIADNTNIPHLSYIGDSIIGENVNIGAGTITANLRFDHKPINVTVNGARISTGRKKMGAIIGDNVQLGVNCSIMPGVKIFPNATIAPHTALYKDVETSP